MLDKKPNNMTWNSKNHEIFYIVDSIVIKLLNFEAIYMINILY